MSQNRPAGAATSRRDFLAASTAAALAANLGIVRGAYAAGDETLKVGVIGCGGRGRGAMVNALEASPDVKVVAVADVFQDRVNEAVRIAGDRGNKIAQDRQFVGFDAFQKLLDSAELDYVILATPPHFRPQHLAAAVKAGRHVFMEKPVAVDAPGCRSVIESGETAKKSGLSIVAGTQRRHQAGYLETYERIQEGAIGRILAARCYWNQGQLWYKERQSGWGDMEWMIRDWVNWAWLSGDHICEQHVHNLDVINWFTSPDNGANHPVAAVGVGGRARRVTGNQYDFFSIDFEYPEGLHVYSSCRQINGCANDVSEFIVGEKGSSNCNGQITTADQSGSRRRNRREKTTDPYVQEHIDLIDSIKNKKGLNEARNVATSTLTAVMGRIAAYTGEKVTWDEVMKSNERLGPPEYNFEVALPSTELPVPGKA